MSRRRPDRPRVHLLGRSGPAAHSCHSDITAVPEHRSELRAGSVLGANEHHAADSNHSSDPSDAMAPGTSLTYRLRRQPRMTRSMRLRFSRTARWGGGGLSRCRRSTQLWKERGQSMSSSTMARRLASPSAACNTACVTSLALLLVECSLRNILAVSKEISVEVDEELDADSRIAMDKQQLTWSRHSKGSSTRRPSSCWSRAFTSSRSRGRQMD